MKAAKAIKKITPFLVIAALSACIGGTGATTLHVMSLENAIKTSPFEGEIVEDQEGLKDHVKKTRFQNNSDIGVFIRVAYSESWTGSGGEQLPLEALDRSGGLVRVATPRWNSETEGDWADGGDGWLYYKKVLQPHSSTPIFVYDVQFLGNREFNDLEDAAKYTAADYDLHFVMEMVQASSNATVSREAVSSLFGEDLAGVVPEPEPGSTKWDTTAELSWPGLDDWDPPATVNIEEAEGGTAP